MKGKYSISLFLVAVLVASCGGVPKRDRNKKPYKVVCYLGSWANYRRGLGKFLIEHIDPWACTHLIYGFAKLSGNQIRAYDPYLDLKENWGLGAFNRFNNLKKENPQLTTLIAIGGWNEGSKKYSAMAANASSRAVFIRSVVQFLERYDFDGLDLDWEYPANRGGIPEDKQNFVTLLRELQDAFRPHGYLLTAAVSAGQKTIDKAYDIPGVARYLDFINVMAYDLHGSWETFTGHNAPLYAKKNESDDMKILNVDYAISYWLSKGAPANKVVLGMGTYGRSFTLKDPKKNGLYQNTTGKGKAGPMTKEPGMLGYNEICRFIGQQGWNVVWDDDYKAPYAYKGNQWVGYDDTRSLKYKVDYLKRRNLAGGMIWSLETDDYRGNCGAGKYPLLTFIMEMLNGRIVRPPTTPAPPTTSPRPTPPRPTRPTLPPGFKLPCPSEGLFRHPLDCTKFYKCTRLNNDYVTLMTACPPGTRFDKKTKTCIFHYLVKDC